MENIVKVFTYFRIIDLIDIIIVSIIFYKLLKLIRETRAEQLIKGLFVLLVVYYLSKWFSLNMIEYILNNTLKIGVIALLIVFQPELRRGLEYIGRTKFLSISISEVIKQENKENIENIIVALEHLSSKKIGALVVMEKITGLNEIISTGTVLESKITTPLLINIFQKNAPLHDGAVIIRKNKIMAAGCFLPLSTSKSISRDLGTRHRAAIGMSENSDAVVLVVSEEKSEISIAFNGKISRNLNKNQIREFLTCNFINDEDSVIKKKWRNFGAKRT